MARSEPIVIPETEGPRLVEIRQSIARACRHLAEHEAYIEANGGPHGHERPVQDDGTG